MRYHKPLTIPTATRADGEDGTPNEAPPPPVKKTPSTPPRTFKSALPVTPLKGLSLTFPGSRPPRVKTLDRKARDNETFRELLAKGVKKPSPICRARPGEDGPRRLQIDRRAERELVETARAALVPVIAVSPPLGPAPADIACLQITLSQGAYDLV
ncbi:hypothetical protein F5883DRAFT_524897 [Diaporthe sp. PMI_573]|nr:hypothetical protein F5883DRAFT_524897 [Diaporthaceae sp. PMI_573]